MWERTRNPVTLLMNVHDDRLQEAACNEELPTPGLNAGKQRGRDHNPYGFTTWLAGGGVKRGHIHGATDEFGFAAAEKPVHIRDLHATILHLLGFDHHKFTYRYAGLDYRLTGVEEGPKVVSELLA